MVRTGVNRDNIDMGTGSNPYTGVLLHLDTNKLLSLEPVHALPALAADGGPADIFLHTAGARVMWSNPTHVLVGGERVLYVLDLMETAAVAGETPKPCERYISWGGNTAFHALRVCVVPNGDGASLADAATAMLEGRESKCRVVVSLQTRSQYATSRMVASKRKRVPMSDSLMSYALEAVAATSPSESDD